MNKNWIAAGFMGLGTGALGIVVLLTGILISQRQPITESSPQAATQICTLTFTIQVPTDTPGPTANPSITPTPVPVGQCVNVKLYRVAGSSWTPIVDFSTVRPGDTVYVSVVGAASGGIIDSARFSINSGAWIQTTQINPFGEYYYQYSVPITFTNLSIKAEVHHTALGWL